MKNVSNIISIFLILSFSVIAMHDLIIGDSNLQYIKMNKTQSHSTHSGIVHENYSHQFSSNLSQTYFIQIENVEKSIYVILDEQTNLNFYLDKIWEPPKHS